MPRARRTDRGRAVKFYPYTRTVPATEPLGPFHASVWRTDGKVYILLHAEAMPERELALDAWQPFASSAPWQRADAKPIAASWTQCLYDDEANAIREPLADRIFAVCEAYRLGGAL